MKGGMGVPHLFQADLRKFKISMPSYAEQVAIATFLDRETAQIDTLIAKQERLIALLQEKRHALISHAVTKGLNPAAPMKESGDKWIGVIPDHWMCQQLKHVVAVPVTDGPHVTPELIADGIPFLSAEAVKNNKLDFSKKRGFIDPAVHEVFARKCQPVRNDVLMVKSGNTTGAIAWVDTDEVFSIWSPLALIRANRELMSPRYLFYYTNEAPFQISILLACSYGTQPNIGMGVIERQPVTVPPVEEQVRIAAFLDRETAKIDDLVEKTHGAIVLAKERRSALISAAVTGKIDVRTLVN
jgi:type I restriction enzyme S subunit